MATKQNLLELANDNNVPVDDTNTVAEIKAALLDAQVDLSLADVVKEVVIEEPEVVESDEEVVVKMERLNWSYQSGPYLFSQEHPYQVVKKSDVDHLVNVEGGFRLATESELREFYG